MVPLVYVIGLVAMVFTALAYAQMAKSFPLAGSVFSYVGRGIHPAAGFFAGWAILLDYLLVPTLLYVFAAESMVGLFPSTPRWLWAIIFVIVNTIINLLGVGTLKVANRVFLAIGSRHRRCQPAQRRLEHDADLESGSGQRTADRLGVVDCRVELLGLRRDLHPGGGIHR